MVLLQNRKLYKAMISEEIGYVIYVMCFDEICTGMLSDFTLLSDMLWWASPPYFLLKPVCSVKFATSVFVPQGSWIIERIEVNDWNLVSPYNTNTTCVDTENLHYYNGCYCDWSFTLRKWLIQRQINLQQPHEQNFYGSPGYVYSFILLCYTKVATSLSDKRLGCHRHPSMANVIVPFSFLISYFFKRAVYPAVLIFW